MTDVSVRRHKRRGRPVRAYRRRRPRRVSLNVPPRTYREIERGQKLEEYRRLTPHWRKYVGRPPDVATIGTITRVDLPAIHHEREVRRVTVRKVSPEIAKEMTRPRVFSNRGQPVLGTPRKAVVFYLGRKRRYRK